MPSAVISAATAATHEIVAAPGSGKVIRVFGYFLAPASSVVLTWKSASTAKSGAMTVAVPQTVPYNPNGWFDCAPNEALNLTLGGAVQVSGTVSYVILG